MKTDWISRVIYCVESLVLLVAVIPFVFLTFILSPVLYFMTLYTHRPTDRASLRVHEAHLFKHGRDGHPIDQFLTCVAMVSILPMQLITRAIIRKEKGE